MIGSGAREHALARAMLRAREGRQVIIAPGNGGAEAGATPGLARTALDVNRIEEVVALAERTKPDLIVIGPEAPLCAGVVDALSAAGFLTFGPNRAAARLEASKAFVKELATRAGIPTAGYDIVKDMAAAERAIDTRGAPVVVKADGLCAGKGVVVAKTKDEAMAAAQSMLEDNVFGEAGRVVVIEDCLVGREVSVHAICDGERYVLLPPARDHKRIFDGDRGPNTGGMGVVCPAPDIGPDLVARIDRELIAPTLKRMRDEGTPFRGVLFAGVMVTDAGPLLLEHNVRFGDPECETMMELIDGDLAEVLRDAARGALDPATLRVRSDRSAVVVVLAAEGYPATPVTGDPINGIDAAEALGVTVHHAGTKREGDRLVTSGGRVLAVAASAATLLDAQALAYRGCKAIDFRGMQYRRDIGKSTLEMS
ncbi:MAG: phosphoribosylamine--glycine ligase [Myxococcales bacterium]|nr:phosphoribosylamine--glycine ligase [Myxococcales bacterium]